MRIAILGNAGSWYVKTLSQAAAARGHQAMRVDFRRLTASVCGAHTQLTAGEIDFAHIDAVVVRTMPPGSLEQVVYRMDALAALQTRGVMVSNPPKAIECCVDKFLTTARLAAAGLPVPQTVCCEDAESALQAFEQLGGDVVVKPLFGSEGRGIMRVSHHELALRSFRTIERIGGVLYLQKFVPHGGFDIRVLVLDGQVVGAIRRTSRDDFRTNISQAAKAESHELRHEEAELALNATRVTEAAFAGVDLVYNRDREPLIIEVNAVPGWRAFARVTRLDVSDRFVTWLEQSVAAR